MIIYVLNFILAKNIALYLFNSVKGDSYKIISLDLSAAFFVIAVFALYFMFIEAIPYFIYLYHKHADVFYEEEKKIIRWTLLTVPMGLIGSVFSFIVVKNMIIPFFLEFSKFLGVEPIVGFVQVTQLTFTMAISFFLIFQLPLVIKILTSMRIVSKDSLKIKEVRLTMIFVICAVSALLTPSDLLSMIIVAMPIYSTYELGILISSDDSNYVECDLKEILG